MKLLDIGEVCEQTGLKPSALRYYEEVGLIASACRSGLRRQYAPEVVIQLALISMGKTAGFNLEEISAMFGQDGQPNLSRIALRNKADELGSQIKQLKIMRDLLRHTADCSAPRHMECPTFRRLVDLTLRKNGTGSKQQGLRAKPSNLHR